MCSGKKSAESGFAVSRRSVRVCIPLEKLVLRPSPCYKTVYHIISVVVEVVVSASVRGG